MKKYTKPIIISSDVLEPDQAIAACSKGKGQFVTKFLGYHETWDRSYASVADGKGTVYSSVAEAKAAAEAASHTDAPIGGVYGCWYVLNGTYEWVCYYEDLDLDEVLDLKGGDNWQNVMTHSEIWEGYYIS